MKIIAKRSACIALCVSALFFSACRVSQPAHMASSQIPKESSQSSHDKSEQSVRYVGVRSSSYGFDEAPEGYRKFPEKDIWKNIINNVSGQISNSQPAAIWIVGNINWSECSLQFPSKSDSVTYKNIKFSSTDRHEPYLNHFDTSGIKVFLQVEPGEADVEDCIDLVLSQ